jgi:drug/metabolite transporter (DMT)-like permease
MNPRRLHAYLLLLIVVAIWGIAGPVIKLTLKVLPADTFLLYRLFLSSIVAVIVFLVRGVKLPGKLSTLIKLLIYGLLTSTAALGFLFWGLEKTSLIDMSLISIFGPVLIILGGWFFLKERIIPREKIGIVIAFLGSLLIVAEPLLRNHHGSGQFIGNLLILASLLAGAASSVLLKKLLREKVEPLTITNITFLIGFISFIPFVMARTGLAESVSIIKNISLPYHLGVFYMAVFSGTVAYTLSSIAQKTIEVSEAALFSYLHPILSALLAIFLLGDRLNAFSVVGATVTFIGVAVAEIRKKRYNTQG